MPPKVSFVERHFLWCPIFRVSLNGGSTVCMFDAKDVVIVVAGSNDVLDAFVYDVVVIIV